MIFVETSFFYALASTPPTPTMSASGKSSRTLDAKRLPDLCLTTNHVVAETITLARSSTGHEHAVQLGERLYAESLARIHWTTPDEERAAFAYFKKHRDKDTSSIA